MEELPLGVSGWQWVAAGGTSGQRRQRKTALEEKEKTERKIETM